MLVAPVDLGIRRRWSRPPLRSGDDSPWVALRKPEPASPGTEAQGARGPALGLQLGKLSQEGRTSKSAVNSGFRKFLGLRGTDVGPHRAPPGPSRGPGQAGGGLCWSVSARRVTDDSAAADGFQLAYSSCGAVLID